MELTNTLQMLRRARQGRYAVGAFNAENMETVQAIAEAAALMKAPVIIQTTSGSVKFAGLDFFAAMAAAAVKKYNCTAALHLDHGTDYDLCQNAVQAGYTSVMIDGSKFELEKNIELSKKVVDYAAPYGISVEAEIGRLGGKEDDSENETSSYTDPSEAAYFARQTGVHSLAIAIGTAHGIYKVKPVLDIERISAVRALTDVPLVLHGASGLSEDNIKSCIEKGICKVNFATELRQAFTGTVKDYLANNINCIDPKEYLRAARENVKQKVIKYIKVCGCAGKA